MHERKRGRVGSRRCLPFPDRRAGLAFNKRFKTLVGELLRQAVAARIPPENTHTFYHGRQWTQRRSDGSEMTGSVQANSATTELRFDAVIEGRLDTIAAQARSIIEQMATHIAQTLYATVSEAVEQAGNVVDAKGKTTPEAFLEMLRKIEFGVNRKGEVTRPELHLHPATLPKVVGALKAAGPDFELEVQRVTAEKEAEALARERQRKSRFKRRTDY